MSWWNTPIPLWQLGLVVTAYVIYKELVKLAVKLTYKRLRGMSDARLRQNQGGTVLGQPADEGAECPAPREVPGPLELDDQRTDPDTGHRP